MDMPGEYVVIRGQGGLVCRIMHKVDVTQIKRWVQVDLQVSIVRRAQDIVVTDDELEADVRELLPPQLEILHVIVGGTMEHVSYNNDLLRMIPGDQLLQYKKVFLHNICRNCNAGFPEVCGLPHMEVCYNQSLLFLPIDRSSGGQSPVLFPEMK